MTMVVAIGSDGPASDDRSRIRAIPLEQPYIDHRSESLAGKWGSAVIEHSLSIRGCLGNCGTSQLHDLFCDPLRIANHLDFRRILLSSFEDSPLRITDGIDTGLFEHFRIDHR